MWPLMHVVENGMLRTDAGLPAHPDVRGVQFDLHHVSGAHPPALGHAMNQGLVQVKYKRLLRRMSIGLQVDVGWLAARDERPGRRGCSRVLGQSTGRGSRRFEMGRYILLLGTAARAPNRASRLALFMFALPEVLLAV